MSEPLLPITDDEPRPYIVKVWRYFHMTPHHFVTRDDAVEFATMMIDEDCSVEGVFNPDGSLDEDLQRRLFPWRYPAEVSA